MTNPNDARTQAGARDNSHTNSKNTRKQKINSKTGHVEPRPASKAALKSHETKLRCSRCTLGKLSCNGGGPTSGRCTRCAEKTADCVWPQIKVAHISEHSVVVDSDKKGDNQFPNSGIDQIKTTELAVNAISRFVISQMHRYDADQSPGLLAGEKSHAPPLHSAPEIPACVSPSSKALPFALQDAHLTASEPAEHSPASVVTPLPNCTNRLNESSSTSTPRERPCEKWLRQQEQSLPVTSSTTPVSKINTSPRRHSVLAFSLPLAQESEYIVGPLVSQQPIPRAVQQQREQFKRQWQADRKIPFCPSQTSSSDNRSSFSGLSSVSRNPFLCSRAATPSPPHQITVQHSATTNSPQAYRNRLVEFEKFGAVVKALPSPVTPVPFPKSISERLARGMSKEISDSSHQTSAAVGARSIGIDNVLQHGAMPPDDFQQLPFSHEYEYNRLTNVSDDASTPSTSSKSSAGFATPSTASFESLQIHSNHQNPFYFKARNTPPTLDCLASIYSRECSGWQRPDFDWDTVRTCPNRGSGSSKSAPKSLPTSSALSSLHNATYAHEVDGAYEHFDDDGETDTEDEEDDGSRRQKGKNGANLTETARRFICPYYARSQSEHCKHTACYAPGFKTVHRIKEHIYRDHLLKPYCPRCYQFFESSDSLSLHLNARTRCDRGLRPNLWVKGCNEQQVKQLKKRPKRNVPLSEEAKYFDMYRILFPEDEEHSFPMPYRPPFDKQFEQILLKRLKSFLAQKYRLFGAEVGEQINLVLTQSIAEYHTTDGFSCEDANTSAATSAEWATSAEGDPIIFTAHSANRPAPHQPFDPRFDQAYNFGAALPSGPSFETSQAHHGVSRSDQPQKHSIHAPLPTTSSQTYDMQAPEIIQAEHWTNLVARQGQAAQSDWSQTATAIARSETTPPRQSIDQYSAVPHTATSYFPGTPLNSHRHNGFLSSQNARRASVQPYQTSHQAPQHFQQPAIYPNPFATQSPSYRGAAPHQHQQQQPTHFSARTQTPNSQGNPYGILHQPHSQGDDQNMDQTI